MKFSISTKHSFSWPVKMMVPDPKRAGAKMEQKFTGQFLYLPRSEVNQIAEHYKTLTDPGERADNEHELIRRVFVGWDADVVDDDGEAIAFSAEALNQALELDWFRAGVYRAYAEATSQERARRGN